MSWGREMEPITRFLTRKSKSAIGKVTSETSWKYIGEVLGVKE